MTNRPGCRVSWQASRFRPTTSSKTTATCGAATTARWIPELVKGVFFASKAFRLAPVPGIADVTASVRALIGAPAPPDAAGKSLWQ